MVIEEKEKESVLIDITNVISSISSKPTITGLKMVPIINLMICHNY